MFLLPFQVDFKTHRFPLITIALIVLCSGVFWLQRASDTRWQNTADFACSHADESLRALLSRHAASPVAVQCRNLVELLAFSGDPERQLPQLADYFADTPYAEEIGGRDGVMQLIGQFWADTQRLGGALPLTSELVYRPRSFNPWRMLTATVAHASWGHLLGNLFFFYLFGATLEAILGHVRYSAFLLALALGTHSVYSFASLGHNAPPTLGLSGVVYGVMGLFAYFLPDAKIRSFVWLLVRFWITPLSAWFIALWYVGGDALSLLLNGNGGGVNLVAHVSGAAIALLLGMTIFHKTRDWIREEAKPYLQRYI